MKRYLNSFTVLVLLLTLQGCCIDFHRFTSGTVYNVGDVFNSRGTDILVEQLQWGNGQWTTEGEARIDSRGYARGSGMDINASNVNLNFLFEYPVQKITLKFGELGGNNNIRVNQDFKNVRELTELNGNLIGGARVMVIAVQDGHNWYGSMIVEGTIEDFALGGQELWLDDICNEK